MGFLLSMSCPSLASVVQIWPPVSKFGQFWPSLANLVQFAPNGVLAALQSRQVLGRKSGKFFVPRRVRRRASVARGVGWVEARDPRASALGRFRAAAGADADLRKSAPRVMYGPRFATPGAGRIAKERRLNLLQRALYPTIRKESRPHSRATRTCAANPSGCGVSAFCCPIESSGTED